MSKPYPTYIGDRALICASETVFTWKNPENLLVVIWHEGWGNNEKYWKELQSAVASKSCDFGVVITFFGGSIEEFRSKPSGHLLPLLFRLLHLDPEHPRGCCPITDFSRLGQARHTVEVNSPGAKLSSRANAILGIGKAEQQSAGT